MPTEFGPDLGGHAQSTFPIILAIGKLDSYSFYVARFGTLVDHLLIGLLAINEVPLAAGVSLVTYLVAEVSIYS